MSHKIQSKSAEVLLIEAQPTRRTMLAEGLKQLGFRGVRSTANPKDALSYIEQTGKTPDWVITPLFADQPLNAMQLLSHFIATPDMHECRVSLIVDREQLWSLSNAFEMGLFSWHLRAEDLTGSVQPFEELMTRGAECHWNDTLLAASYLRAHLRGMHAHEDLIRLEKTLLSLYPHHGELVVELAETFYEAGKPQVALMMLAKAGPFKGRYEDQAQRLTDRCLAATGASPSSTASFAQTFELGQCVIVDPDESSRNLIAETLKDLGVTKIQTYPDGAKAYEGMKGQPEPDLIIQEWRLPMMSGDRLVQKIRSHGFYTTPIVVYSSLVKNTDRALLREMGVSDVVQKPQTRKKLAALLMQILEEEKRPKGDRGIELRIRKELQAHNTLAGKALFEKHVANGKAPLRVEKALGAEVAYYEGDMRLASELAVEALTIGGEDIVLLNLLGKVYLRLRKFSQAEQFFERAQSLAPGNVERLCNLAETQVEQENIEDAEESLGQAKAIDADHKLVAATEAKVALLQGDSERTKLLLSKIEGQSDVVAFLNNRAVSLANEKRPAEGIELYRRALEALPESMTQFAPTILYNLALALIKTGEQEKARSVLQRASGHVDSPVDLKVKSLLARANRAKDRGEPLTLQKEKAEELAPVEVLVAVPSELPVAAGVQAGAMRCHLVFQGSLGVDPRVQKLLVTMPSVKPSTRKAG